MNLLKNLSKDIIAPIIVLVVGGYSLYHFTKQDESREINPHSNSGIIILGCWFRVIFQPALENQTSSLPNHR
jgi:hypothetical protein